MRCHSQSRRNLIRRRPTTPCCLSPIGKNCERMCASTHGIRCTNDFAHTWLKPSIRFWNNTQYGSSILLISFATRNAKDYSAKHAIDPNQCFNLPLLYSIADLLERTVSDMACLLPSPELRRSLIPRLRAPAVVLERTISNKYLCAPVGELILPSGRVTMVNCDSRRNVCVAPTNLKIYP